MPSMPMLPLWVADYKADTGDLNNAEHGSYLLLLFHAWTTGSLPNDDVKLSRIARCGLKAWRQSIKPAISRFFVIDDGGWTSPRLEAERRRASARYTQLAGTAASMRAAKALKRHNTALLHKSSDETCSSSKPEPELEKTIHPADVSSPLDADLPAQGELVGAKIVRLKRFDQVRAAIEVWNALAVDLGLPQAETITTSRRTRLAKIVRKHGIDGWKNAIDRIRTYSWMLGDNDRGWRANIDSIIRPDNFQKLVEGAYDRIAPVPRRPSNMQREAEEGLLERSDRLSRELNAELGYGRDAQEHDTAASEEVGGDMVWPGSGHVELQSAAVGD